jgi:hypothetical protein
MFKENGRRNVNVAGVVSDINKETETSYILVDGDKVYIHTSSSKLFSEIESGEYISLECYMYNGKLFATEIKQ